MNEAEAIVEKLYEKSNKNTERKTLSYQRNIQVLYNKKKKTFVFIKLVVNLKIHIHRRKKYTYKKHTKPTSKPRF